MAYALRSRGGAPSAEVITGIQKALDMYGADRVTVSQSETGQGVRIVFNDEDFEPIAHQAASDARQGSSVGSSDDDMDDEDEYAATEVEYAATEVEYAATEINDDVDMELDPVAGPSRIKGHAINGASIASRANASDRAEMGEGGSSATLAPPAPLDKERERREWARHWAALQERMVRALVGQAMAAAARGDKTGAPLPQQPTHQALVMQEVINDYLPAIEEDFQQRLQAARTYDPSQKGKAKAIDLKRVEEIRAMVGTPGHETTTVVRRTRFKNALAPSGTLIMDHDTGLPKQKAVGLCTVRRTQRFEVIEPPPEVNNYDRRTDRRDKRGAPIIEKLKRIDKTTIVKEVVEEVEIDTE
ncbi:hypothetical protein HETIRDRAFT_412268 [Heterobasidion irregulare TC 32-1]|uniref:Uncharacterized protein n=1 Tax=Heterobasidion irregulare (strain TC 32-1) TaxID=747525 RepID=W4JR26_HETIT|nr:uncharacterized protein HETIRDRAFT_412268 [Heterobasidion irregulare TC 32-1]ETW76022.1 hypothetical protein HETIRDRAFT_412268 [Heterobasidion irregulare TC 32-1]